MVDSDVPKIRYPKPADFVPEPVFLPGERWAGKPRCKAWSCNHGRQCNRVARTGMRVCRSHGGANAGGFAAPAFKHGRTSKYLIPARLQDSYKAAIDDEELLTLRNEISLADARLQDLLNRVDTGEAGVLWRNAQAAYYDMRTALAGGADKVAEFNQAMGILERVLSKGVQDYHAWDEVKDLFELRRRLVETERRREIDLKLYMSAEQAYNYMRDLAKAVASNVKDRQLLAKIQHEFAIATNFGGGIPRIDEDNVIEARSVDSK